MVAPTALKKATVTPVSGQDGGSSRIIGINNTESIDEDDDDDVLLDDSDNNTAKEEVEGEEGSRKMHESKTVVVDDQGNLASLQLAKRRVTK